MRDVPHAAAKAQAYGAILGFFWPPHPMTAAEFAEFLQRRAALLNDALPTAEQAMEGLAAFGRALNEAPGLRGEASQQTET